MSEPFIERHRANITGVIHNHAPTNVDADVAIDSSHIGVRMGWHGNDHTHLEVAEVRAIAPLPKHVAGIAFGIAKACARENLAHPHCAKVFSGAGRGLGGLPRFSSANRS